MRTNHLLVLKRFGSDEWNLVFGHPFHLFNDFSCCCVFRPLHHSCCLHHLCRLLQSGADGLLLAPRRCGTSLKTDFLGVISECISRDILLDAMSCSVDLEVVVFPTCVLIFLLIVLAELHLPKLRRVAATARIYNRRVCPEMCKNRIAALHGLQ